jgi:hypothetical protein
MPKALTLLQLRKDGSGRLIVRDDIALKAIKTITEQDAEAADLYDATYAFKDIRAVRVYRRFTITLGDHTYRLPSDPLQDRGRPRLCA